MPRGVKNGVNQSEAIREQLKINSSAKPSEIKQALAAKGIKVSDSLISAVKYRKTGKKKKGKGKKRGRPAAVPAAAAKRTKAAASNGSVSIDTLVAASKLVKSLGGADNAIKAINILKQING